MSKRKRRGANQAEHAEAPTTVQQPGAGERRLLPVDIQQKEFRLAFRGYNEHDVDEFLDHVTEELARLHEENKRLTERATEGGSGAGAYGGAAPGALIEDAQRRAEEIVREAREQAASILSNAGSAPGEAPGAEPGPAPAGDVRTFLSREREFLQGLAGLIQQHAAAVKEDAQRARTASAPPAEPEPAPGFMDESMQEPAPDLARTEEPAFRPLDTEETESARPLATGSPGTDDAWSTEGDRGDAWASPAAGDLGGEKAADEVAPLQPPPAAFTAPASGGPEDTAAWVAPPEPWSEPGSASRGEPEWASPYGTEDDAITPEPPRGAGRDILDPPSTSERNEERRSTIDPGSSPPPASAPRQTPAFGPSTPVPPRPAPPQTQPQSPQTEVQQPGLDDAADPAEREDDDRSLRELFWGEE